jgi:hypothetical protein
MPLAFLLNKIISIKTLLILAIWMVAMLSMLGYMLLGSGRLYDSGTVWITLAICVFLGFGLAKSDDILFPMVAMMSIFFILFIFPRVLLFQYLPGKIRLPMPVMLSVQQINYGYSYIAAGAAALGMGFFLARYLLGFVYEKRDFYNPLPLKTYSVPYLAIVLLVVGVIQIYVSVWLGDSVLLGANYGTKNKLIGIISVVFNNYLVMLVAIISLLILGRQGKSITVSMVLFVLAFVLIEVILGSRSGGLTSLLLLIAGALVLKGNFRGSIKNYAMILIMVMVLSLFSFYAGTAVRSAMISERDRLTAISDLHMGRRAGFDFMKGVVKEEVRYDISLISPLNRLGAAFDTALLTLSLDPDREMLERTMNMGYAIKSAINIIVPGTFFSDAKVNTALLWPFIYESRNKHLLQTGYYESFLWTAWGVAFAMFGWGMGLIALLVAGIILQSIYIVISSGYVAFQPYLSTLFLLNVFSFYMAMGLDDWLVGVERSFFSLFVVFLMLGVLTRLYRIFSKKTNNQLAV